MPMDGTDAWPAMLPTSATGIGRSGLRSCDQARLPATSGMAQMIPSTWRPISPFRMSSTSAVSGWWMRFSEIE